MNESLAEELSAYLDGELEPEHRRCVEERLARDPDFRGELQALEQAWNMLDRLPRASVGDDFTRSTIEMVAVAAEDEARTQAIEIPRQKRRVTLFGGLAIAIATFAGFAGGTWIWQSPNDQLLDDLPVVQNFDLYRHAESLDFLRTLGGAKLFGEDDSSISTVAAVPADMSARRQWLGNMSRSEQQDLLRNQERFRTAPVAERNRIIEMHKQLSQAADSAQLLGMLEQYHEWLKTLSPEQRAELVELPPDERIERIRKITARQKESRERGRPKFAEAEQPLDKNDLQVVARWFEQLVWDHRQALLESMPPERRGKIEKLPEPAQKRALLWAAVQRWRREPPPIQPEDIDRLAQQLSLPARTQLTPAKPQQQRRMVRMWMHEAMLSRMDSFARRRDMTAISDDDLQRFFQEDLPKRDRDRLLGMPSNEMQQELRQLYLRHADGSDFPPRLPGGDFGPPHRRDMRPPDFRGPGGPGGGRPPRDRRPPTSNDPRSR